MRKIETYTDRFMKDKKFHDEIAQEYRNLRVGEKIARSRQQAHLSQAVLAKRSHTTKSAIARYERTNYHGHCIPLLVRIATACGKTLEIKFVIR